MKAILAMMICLVVAGPEAAQVPVEAVPDAVSYATALVNPALAVYQAIRSDNPQCKLGQLGVSAGITTAGLLAQRFIHSPRPCVGSVGCSGNGMPSLHSAYSAAGAYQNAQSGWRGMSVAFSMPIGTAGLRVAAKRHTPWQVLAGLGLGSVSEWAGQKLVRCGG